MFDKADKYAVYENRKNPLKKKAMNFGSNDRWYDVVCSERYRDEKVEEYLQLFTELFKAFKTRPDIRRGVATVPDDTLFNIDNHDGYNLVLKAFREFANEFYGSERGVLESLQNWGDDDIEKPNIHIHFMVLPFKKDGSVLEGFTPGPLLAKAKLIWRQKLIDNGIISLLKYGGYYGNANVDLEVDYLNKRESKADYWYFLKYKILTYMFRRPITTKGATVENTRERNEKLRGLTRIRAYGWFTPKFRKATLLIFRIETLKPESEWRFLGMGYMEHKKICDNVVFFHVTIRPPPNSRFTKCETCRIAVPNEDVDLLNTPKFKRKYRFSA